mmetsp:Transcript_142274/g.248068  ORF Transcript_142274/g.248068 Transcript_142274/m.248068 type:complete len:223 (-) Transcript_142274:103-771(-)
MAPVGVVVLDQGAVADRLLDRHTPQRLAPQVDLHHRLHQVLLGTQWVGVGVPWDRTGVLQCPFFHFEVENRVRLAVVVGVVGPTGEAHRLRPPRVHVVQPVGGNLVVVIVRVPPGGEIAQRLGIDDRRQPGTALEGDDPLPVPLQDVQGRIGATIPGPQRVLDWDQQTGAVAGEAWDLEAAGLDRSLQIVQRPWHCRVFTRPDAKVAASIAVCCRGLVGRKG